ncbi:MAG TPA: TolC family protein [Polyangiaceae bacterium]|nr:TolC family protein [Polyangiaceae bacterium]
MFARIAVVTLSVLALARSAAAEPAPAVLSLSAASERASRLSPLLGPRRAAVHGAQGVEHAADTLVALPPRIDVAAGSRWRASPGELGPEISVSVMQELSLGGYGRSRERYARALTRGARADLTVAVEDARTAAALSWVEARLARESVRIMTDSLEQTEGLERVAASRVAVGRASPAELALTQALVGNAQADLLAAQGRSFVADASLRYLTALPANTPLELAGSLDAPAGELDRVSVLRQAHGVQPDRQAARRAVERATSAAEMVAAGGKPLLALGPSVTHEATGDWILLIRVGIPLPLVNPAGVEASRLRLDADVAAAAERYVESTLEHEVLLALEERTHARELAKLLGDSVVGAAAEALRLAVLQYEAGKIDFAAALAARRELLAAEHRRAQAAADVRRADIRLARLLGHTPENSEEGPLP